MKLCPRRAAAALLAGMLVVSVPAYALSCLLFPLSCLKPSKKFGDELEALVLDVSSTKTEYLEVNSYGQVHSGWSALNNSQDFYVWFRVGETLYEGWHQNTGMIASMVGYKPKRAEWVGKTFKMRFYDEKFLGIAGVGALFKRPDGDDWRLTIIQIYGPDGVPECKFGIQVCPPQAKIDRAAREAEQLARLQKTGGKSATDVLPAPVDIPSPPPAAAATVSTDSPPAADPVPAAAPAPAPAPVSPPTEPTEAAPQ
ncbi:MAG: hypothetical protein IPI06_03305 [Gammaproteobacteria bacterium]|nr:hypothetical protein [Gammaproteobacteria bacterium]